jgi:hypothetical protein
MKSDLRHEQITALFNFFSYQTPDRLKKKNFDKINEILGYELLFVFSAIVVNKYSGNLIIINEKNELSGVNFLNGSITGIDYPDKEYLLGNLIVEEEIISKDKMKEILSKNSGQKLGSYLISESLVSEQQLRKILYKQSRLRISKYMKSENIRVNFNFDEVAHAPVLISNLNFFEILHNWIFDHFKPEWLQSYATNFDKLRIMVNPDPEDLNFFLKFPNFGEHFNKMKNLPSKNIKFTALSPLLNTSYEESLRWTLFMMQAGFVSWKALVFTDLNTTSQTESIKSDFISIRSKILLNKYYEAFSIISKYSSQINSNEMVEFYFAWVRLHSKYYQKFNLDLSKTANAIARIDPNKVGFANYFYVKALLAACNNEKEQCLNFYSKAVQQDASLKAFPILSNNEKVSDKPNFKSFFSRILTKIGLN